MDDYVLRKSVYDALCKICNNRGACERNGSEGCHKVFADIPAADVVEVVRCKDCKHFFDDGTDNVAIYKCELLHEKMRDDFFCADGERRTENE